MKQDETTFEMVCEQIEGKVKRPLTLEERVALRRVYEANMRILVIEPAAAS